ncbi:MAG TPA: NADP-dependent oxidoreductase [Sandaracinaceae bacterium LLY-WYZ-13_1]|nr:NADP-dependent oxidoreductase [Sandaracinaceae bacterium LLY-WYZ-13_1]
MSDENLEIRLASRPTGAPRVDDFRLERGPAPTPGDGEVLLRTRYLSLDPYMRGRMSDAPSYAEPVPVGEVMIGGAVGVVEQSRHPGFAEGDHVLGTTGWRTRAVADGAALRKLDLPADRVSLALGALGMPGLTAWWGLNRIGEPRAGETLVVAAATGPVGSMVGQLARRAGMRAVGIAGGPDKCRFATETLGFDACLDHRADGLAERLVEACPDGIDVYFENVGGAVLEAVAPLLNVHARVPLCGLVAHYNDTSLPEGPDRTPLLLGLLLRRRIRLQGFIIADHFDAMGAFLGEVAPAVLGGEITVREDVVDGLENAPEAFIGMLEGKNFGKLVVRVS